MIQSQVFEVRIEFLTPLLGCQPTIDVAAEYIAAAGGFELPEDEAATLPEALERGTTVFHKLDDKPVLWDYQVKGFLKEAGRALNGKVHGGVKNLRSKVDQYVFVLPRMIPLAIPAGQAVGHLDRPLRAETAQGPRSALARSEYVAEGTSIAFKLQVVAGGLSEQAVRDLLDYGQLRGIGQWRSGGWGRFSYTMEEAA